MQPLARFIFLVLVTCSLAARAADSTNELIWSLKPVQPVAVPASKSKWPKNEIDQFVFAKLEEKKFAPSKPADKRTLIRRASYDLTGLPPTPDETHAFLADRSPGAFAKVVDRLLASPRYGERWARHWLDVVHYADSHGHDQDRPRPNAWPYRDYVIRAFNEDKPYARFVEEQLAGDVLFPDDPNGVVATGFIVAGPWDLSSLMAIMDDTVDKKNALYLDRDDMVMNTMSTFTSTTVHCARCHNHKFDPIPQKDYYALQAVFAGVDRADRPYDLDAAINSKRQALLRKKLALEINDRKTINAMLTPEVRKEIAAWEKSIAGEEIWTVLDPETFTTASKAVLTKQKDLSLLASGESPKTDIYTITANTDLKNITAIRLEVLTDSSHPRNGPGRQPDNGNLHLSEFKLFAAAKTDTTNKRVNFQTSSADFNQDGWTIEKSIDGDTNTAWGIFPETGKPHYAIFELKENIGFENATKLTFVLEQLHGREHTILRPRLSVTTKSRPVKVEALPDNVKKLLAIKPDQRTDDQAIELAAFYLNQQTDKHLAGLPQPQMVYAAANDFAPKSNFKPARTPRLVEVLKRGDVQKPIEPAQPGALSCVSELQSHFDVADQNDEGARRAALARWITDAKNPLTWRSIVNRVWHYHFGRGIVETPNDFGKMGAQPTHPELLDWLANRFQQNGGSFKKLHRLIMLSAAYQQGTDDNPQFDKTDSDNRYLWRMNRSRLDAEEIRDTVLQHSGKLDLTMYGAPVKQFKYEDPNPDLTPHADYTAFNVDDTANFRRSIYRFIFRTVPDPLMDTLDCADAAQLTPVRNVSMTALQALSMWNNAFVLRQTEHLADRLKKSGNTRAQITLLYQLALNREPSRAELKELTGFAEKEGMASACRVILNSNEFIFVN
ncbi:MAG: Protein of unknown function (DUF1553)/Protein of unknown function (DUF1549)/Planctomycete [Verrucomicrobiales bacterium]|nr:Protein of unknown function (DUF1553)/Protein of unknown function (DUF1549)/Planctomycete [Verrucomicrobiales bacterium]